MKTFLNISTIALFIIVLFAFSSVGTLQAEVHPNAAASVIAVRGNVSILSHDGVSRSLKINDPIYLQETIETGKRGRIQILFSDNTIISLSSKSLFKVSEYQFKKNKTGKLKTSVNEGVFRVMGGMLTKTSPDKFTTETPSGNIGIRGSMYSGNVIGKQLSVVFEGGKGITVRNKTGMVTITKPGHGTKSSGQNSPLQKPFKFSSENLNFIRQLSSTTSGQSGNSGGAAGGAARAVVSFSAGDVPTNKPPDQAPPTEAAASPETAPGAPAEENLEIVDPESAKLTEMVQSNPDIAAIILQKAVKNDGINVESALSAVFKGMKNTSKESFDKVLSDALDMGLTVESAKKIVDDMKASGVCK